MWEYNYTNELYHYGVPGMRWGHRKNESYYRNKAQKSISKMKSSKTKLGKHFHNYSAYINEQKANVKRSNKNETNILKRLDNKYGHGANASSLNASSNFYKRLASYQTKQKAKTKSEARSYNAKSAANANERLHNAKNPIDYGKKYIEAKFNRPVKTAVGRKTTSGKVYVDNLLTLGVVGLIKDAKYKRNSKKGG